MSKADGKCNYCNRLAVIARQVVYSDVIVCSEACDDAMSALMDGVSTDEVQKEWEQRTGLKMGGSQ